MGQNSKGNDFKYLRAASFNPQILSTLRHYLCGLLLFSFSTTQLFPLDRAVKFVLTVQDLVKV